MRLEAFMPSAPTAKYLQEYTENVRSVLKENGFKDHTNNGRWYLGIGLKAETTQP